MTNIESEIKALQAEIAKNNPEYRPPNSDADWIFDKRKREHNAKIHNLQKIQESALFKQKKKEACEAMLANPLILWYLENVLSPQSIIPKDIIELEVDSRTRRKQIEAMKIAEILDDILKEGVKKV